MGQQRRAVTLMSKKETKGARRGDNYCFLFRRAVQASSFFQYSMESAGRLPY